MEADIKERPDKICRTCLCKSSNMRSLTTKIEGDHRTLLEVLVFVADLDIKSSSKLPAQVCNDCELIICKFDAFKQQCIQSESTLNQQMIIDTPEEFELEINEKPVIKKELKKELTVKKVKIGKGPHKKRSKLPKGSKSKFLKLLQTSTFKNEKDDIATLDVASSSVETNVDTLLDMKFLGKEVKIETLNDDNDLGMDFGDNEQFDSPLEFKQESAVSEVSVYSCSCGTVFNTEDEYKTHLEHKTCNGYTKSMKIKLEKRNPNGGRKITIKRRIVCPECNLEFETIKACRLHQQKHKNDDENGIFECTKCMRKFNRKSSYTTHINHHDIKANVKYTCDSCKRQFQHKAHLDNHILAVHTREKGYTCEICNTNFSTQESLDAHKDSHKIEKKHQCKLCKKAFYMLSTLNDHMRIHTGEKPFLCSICGRGFSQKTNLAQHMRRHQGLKPFKCEECDRGFVSKGELVAHTRKHSGAHPFVCDDCGSGFTTSSSLVKHRRIHTGERPYACDLCPLRFAASGTLKNHRRTHTGEKPYQCSYCEKAFVQRQDLVSHIRCHTGERPFACGCGQAFRKAASLKQHVKMHAKDQLMHMVHCEATHAASATGLG